MTTVSQLLTVGIVVTVVSGVDVVNSGLEFFCLLTLPVSAVSPLARFRWGISGNTHLANVVFCSYLHTHWNGATSDRCSTSVGSASVKSLDS